MNNLYNKLRCIENYQEKLFIINIIKSIGILKRDILQNRSRKLIDGIPSNIITCTNFLINKVLNQMQNEEQLINKINYNPNWQIEFCYNGIYTILLGIFSQNNDTLTIIDAIKLNVLYSNNKNIYKILFADKVAGKYENINKIFSKIMNVLFNNMSMQFDYQEIEQIKNIRPLYEKIILRSGQLS